MSLRIPIVRLAWPPPNSFGALRPVNWALNDYRLAPVGSGMWLSRY